MKSVLVLNVVGLTPRILQMGAPHLNAVAETGFQATVDPVVPAVTCPVQATYLTGLPPRKHGIVANGWYHRHTAEVRMWLQSNHLVRGEKIWETGRRRDSRFTCAKLFWWFNMYSTADWSVTPRPAYCADGRKIPDVYAEPLELRRELVERFGEFPLFKFWGPGAGIESSAWIARAAEHVLRSRKPTLTLAYLPHLDYDLQRHGPTGPAAERALREIDSTVRPLVDAARTAGVEVIVLSEYGLSPATGHVDPNRALRREGFLRVQENAVGELLDAGASRAFALADHQVAHVYVKDPADRPPVQAVLEKLPGVAEVLDSAGKARLGLDHPRSGELVLLAEPGFWFTYYYWLEDERAPDFARTVDIHRKPGYDPAELFLDPSRPRAAKLRVGVRLLQKSLKFRYLMDVIGLDASVVKGTHGLAPATREEGAVLLSSSRVGATERIPAAGVKDLILETVFAGK
jgi:predicted AlkP superfamily pyrophosphatase or phosphodiesterase